MKLDHQKIIDILKEIKPHFQSKGIEKIALFGSFAKSEENFYSDLDIAIKKIPNFLQYYNSYSYFETLNELKEVLGKKLHRNIDIFDLDSRSPFKENIEKELIYA